jgi:hypothetical protein
LLLLLLVLLSLFATPLAAAAGGVYIETGVRASHLVVRAGTAVGRAQAASVTTTHKVESLDDGSERRTVTRVGLGGRGLSRTA